VKHSGIRSQVGNQLLSPECFTPTNLSVSRRSVAGRKPSHKSPNRRSHIFPKINQITRRGEAFGRQFRTKKPKISFPNASPWPNERISIARDRIVTAKYSLTLAHQGLTNIW
jgi:hypothetical protein